MTTDEEPLRPSTENEDDLAQNQQRDSDPGAKEKGTQDPLVGLQERLKSDAGVHFDPAVLERARELYQGDKPAYARLCAELVEAKAVEFPGWKRAVTTAPAVDDGEAGQGQALVLPDPDPWPESVDGAQLLDEIVRLLVRFVILPEHTAEATALWVMHTYAHDAAHATPRLAILSPVKRCGKTTLLSVLNKLVARPLPASNITSAALFRTIEAARLLDEADTFLKSDADELRGIVNSGHTRAAAFVVRIVGEAQEPRRFSTWAPMVIAGIGRLPGTIEDRSIAIELRRKADDEKVERLWGSGVDFEALKSRAARWAADHLNRLRWARPEVPLGMDDRAADNWWPLLAIADAAGGDWPGRARKAAEVLSRSRDDEESIGVRLLADIRQVFDEADVEKIHTVVLIERLRDLEEGPWAAISRGKPLDTNYLSRKLKAFGVAPLQMKIGGTNRNGYYRRAFEEPWRRYLPPTLGPTGVYPSTFGRNAGVPEDAGVYPDSVGVEGRDGPNPRDSAKGRQVEAAGGNGPASNSEQDEKETWLKEVAISVGRTLPAEAVAQVRAMGESEFRNAAQQFTLQARSRRDRMQAFLAAVAGANPADRTAGAERP